MQAKTAVVVTSISEPNKVLGGLASGCATSGHPFIVIGDVSSPPEFHLEGCEFYSLERQLQTGLRFAERCPQKNYARKNIGYLLAIQGKAQVIVETDDDNIPYASFWQVRQRRCQASTVADAGWINVYRYFSSAHMWPRGLPLNKALCEPVAFESLPVQTVDCPIQQGLADVNPDVDAIYRLLLPLPQTFRHDRRVALASGAWCPFNSQNTTWWETAFPLLYLPAYCPFRMADIWRSFVAQRIAWANDWNVLFHEPTVWQERNEHDLMRDFADEVSGYLNNEKICEELARLPIKAGVDHIFYGLELCYEKLVGMGVIQELELPLLEVWIDDLRNSR